MVPADRFPKISNRASFYEAVNALEIAQQKFMAGEAQQRILLVEDDLLDAAAAKRLLRHNALDRDLVIAADGRQAVSILQN